MIKVVLLLLLYNTHSGEVLQHYDPIPGYESMDQCKEVLASVLKESVPYGMSVRGYCLAPGETET